MRRRYSWDEIEKKPNKDQAEAEVKNIKKRRGFDPNKTIERFNEQAEKKTRKPIFLIILVVIIIILISITLLPNNLKSTIVIDGNYVIDDQIIENQLWQSEGSNYFYTSPILQKIQLVSNPYIQNVKIDKDYPYIYLNINENTPVLIKKIDEIDYLIFENNMMIEYSTIDYYVAVPYIDIEDEAVYEALFNNLKKVPYPIIQEITYIQEVETSYESDLLALFMNDGSIIEIYPDQIAEYLPLYPTMQNEVKKKYGFNVEGIYHLDIGKYFEPF